MRRFAVLAALLLVVTVLPAAVAGASGHLGACGDEYVPIYDIQGSGYSSPYSGDYLITEGVVTVDLQKSSELSGFFLQDPDGDGKAKTSDGVFVYHRDSWGYNVEVGDHVRLEARVSEYFGETQLGNIYGGDLMFCGTGEIEPLDLPMRKLTRRGESYEGMYVTFPARLRVTDTYNLHRFGEVFLSQAGVVETPTNQYPAGSMADRFADRNMRKVLLLDDGSTWSNPDPIPFLREGGTLRLGDSVQGLTGAIGYAYGNYRLQPAGDVTFDIGNKRRMSPKVYGDVVVASFNVLNFWTTLGGRGASSAAQYDVQLEKLVAAILGTGADVVGLQEMENDDAAAMAMVAALNTAEGYDGITEGWFWEPATYTNAYPIRNEIIYRSTAEKPITAMWANPLGLQDPAFDTVRPGDDPEETIGRPPVAQMFEYDGETFILVVNHLKSKGSDCDSIGDPDAGDGQGNCNLTRVWQAEVVLDFIDYLTGEYGEPDVLMVGDLNAYAEEDPVLTFESELMNLVKMYDENPWSYAYFNWSDRPWIGRGALDHAFGTASMAAQVNEAKVWHINGDEPRFLDWYDPTVYQPGPFRSSDHDPVVIGLDLG